jgi:transmembrane 9 superfamily protein 1
MFCFQRDAGISGYVAANYYKKMGGENWVWNINLTSALFARE